MAIQFYEVTYLYRDAGNYKFWGSFKIRDRLDVSDLRDHMIERSYFVPKHLRIAPLIPDARNDDDHELHEIDSIQPTEAGPYLCSAAELLSAFRTQNAIGWFR